MKTHSTNYYNTLIEVSEDSRADCGTPPPPKKNRTIAEMQFELISKHPYTFTSDEILFRIYAERNELTKDELEVAKTRFFSRGQPCFRTSPLAKTYGYGIHFDHEGRVAVFGMETEEYQNLLADENIRKIRAMKSGK